MKITRLIVAGIMALMASVSSAQKTISEGTVTYDIAIQPKTGSSKGAGSLNGAKTTIYIKGALSRTDMTSALGTETTIYNSTLGNGVILKEYSGQKLMITLTKENWTSMNNKFSGLTFQNTSETKVIEGYNCKKAVTRLNDGSTISVFYTPDLVSINKDYSQAFKNLPGFPMEYEMETSQRILKYSVSKIDFGPLPISKFDFPKAGYRVMTYDENKKGKDEGDK